MIAAVERRRAIWVAMPVFGLLFALLFQYRILALLGKLGVKATPLGTRFPLTLDFQAAPQWSLPFYYTLDYVNTIWFTTILGLFIGGALVSLAPAIARGNLEGNGPRQFVSGILLGLPNMFCTCCAVTTATGLRRAGAGLLGSLAFFVTAPALNVVVILLAFQLLPLKLAIARTLLGVLAAAGVTYAAARLNPRLWSQALQTSATSQVTGSVPGLMRSWIGNTWNLTRMTVPMLIAGFLIIGVFKAVFPVETVIRQFGDGVWTTLAAAVAGTFLMAPTFTEVLWVQEFTKQGMGQGPAVALLITLPAVSFPSLWVLGKTFGSYRLAASLGLGILLLGFVGGMVFSLF